MQAIGGFVNGKTYLYNIHTKLEVQKNTKELPHKLQTHPSVIPKPLDYIRFFNIPARLPMKIFDLGRC